MTRETVTEANLKTLRKLDTPTACNALETLDEHWRSFGFISEPLVCVDSSMEPMVGYARTATIRGLSRPPESADGVRAKRLAYYRHIGEGPSPSVAVIQDLDPRPGVRCVLG